MHCHAGISRSATVCIAYMMQSQRMSLKEAYEHVRGRRPIISPNLHFMGQLMAFEQELMCKWATTKVPTSSTDIIAVQTPPCYTTQSDRHMSLCMDQSDKHPPLATSSRSMSLPMGNTIITARTTGTTDRRSRDRLTLSLNCGERRKNVTRNHPGSPCRVEANTLNPSQSLTLSTTCT